ncbi:lactonase family protein [Clostridium bowmanii]|uniref:lactonase family protein n=1 Tax=Clostridium bowmanii TaxID=132925 RepID=UPI001C0BB6BC|nr:beta-propeller fold lactonase family protein [Clostridium bowmanii]MBU3188393.1 lactonase family protein [Clostridium bowmanii]MCA1072781.1 lactonase family protein [Clostridium bowmanii]
MKLYISGYGSGATTSIGIFKIENGNILENQLIRDAESSSYLSVFEEYIIGISELEGNSYIHMFKKNLEEYFLIDTKLIKGGLLCYITYLPKNRVLVGACYEGGEIFSIKIGENGFEEMLSFIVQGGNKDKVSRAHCVVPNKSETILYSANIALDMIYSYKIKQGKLFENGYLQLPRGEGPRHILLSHNEETIYVISEYSNKIFIINNDNGKMTLLDSVSTLPENFCEKSYCSTLCMTADGKYIYAANRGANTIAVFSVFEYGNLKKMGDCSCFGEWPRHISLVNMDNFLAIANQGSNQVILSKIDSKTGLLTNGILDIAFNKPSFVCEGR